ncbi:MAG TPA: glycosyl hydrolase 115 family protein [Steroidobacteraceae bacterium]|nr:glycosyl hydrolase 115 family protein [Steroidobacteraceae bacterium]
MRRIASLVAAASCALAIAGTARAAAAPASAEASAGAVGSVPATAPARAATCAAPASVCDVPVARAFTLIRDGRPASLVVDEHDYAGVLMAARDLRRDLSEVSGAHTTIDVVRASASSLEHISHGARPLILIGTLGHSPLIDRLVRVGKLSVTGVEGRWEAYARAVVEAPVPGVPRALVLVGADKRGTIFAIYDLSRRMGVSPWVWWADVPVHRRANLFVAPGRITDAPVVRYRGIFLNDEEPALGSWARAKFGGLNHEFYARVFELILRLKANFLWPAMWSKSIYEDDPRSPALADEMGVVLGTSHHEPMMRAQEDWHRHGKGPWDYTRNAVRLRRFWREGIERMDHHESVVTIGMRGDGDKPMTQGTAIPLLERIVADQRRIIEEVTGRPASETPQVWALYKEVQDYYDRGMRVPDDVTLLFSDDNWGNLRRLPPLGRHRAGGYGIYYHFDYVGGPRSYKWLNTNQIERVWEQMELAHAYGADRLWIVNVGDLKPMEFPTEFFLDLAWNADAITPARLADYPRAWASEQFGAAHSSEIGELLTRYTQYNARRKPELIAPGTYSLVNFREAQRVAADYEALAARARALQRALPASERDAFFELVLFPIEACANLNELYVDDGLDELYAGQGRAATDTMARRVEALFRRDAELTREYHALAGGKWDHMMSQSHFGYVSWRDPPQNIMPAVRTIAVPERASLGVAVEGSRTAWPARPGESGEPGKPGKSALPPPTLPPLSPYGASSRYIDIFDRGATPFRFTATTAQPWLRVSRGSGVVTDQVRIEVHADWPSVPEGMHRVPIIVRGAGESVTVYADIVKRAISPEAARNPHCFVEANGYVAIEAAHYARAVDSDRAHWAEIASLGRTLSGMTVLPMTAPPADPGGVSPHLEYDVYLFDAGSLDISVTLAPTLNFTGGSGLRYAVSIDDETPRIVNIHAGESQALWAQWVSDNAIIEHTKLPVAAAGSHTVKIWMVDPGLDFERIVVAFRPLPRSYLGPPESRTAAELGPGPRVHQDVLSQSAAVGVRRARTDRRQHVVSGI